VVTWEDPLCEGLGTLLHDREEDIFRFSLKILNNTNVMYCRRFLLGSVTLASYAIAESGNISIISTRTEEKTSMGDIMYIDEITESCGIAGFENTGLINPALQLKEFNFQDIKETLAQIDNVFPIYDRMEVMYIDGIEYLFVTGSDHSKEIDVGFLLLL
jgi:hypothetical protein